MGRVTSRIFATLYDPFTAVAERVWFRSQRTYLVEDLEGELLELGAGTGAMFQYYVERDGLAVTAIEPDAHMRRRAARRASRLDLEVTLVDGVGEDLPFDDATFDAVVCPLVLCTVGDLDATLDELARVTKPGGELRFFEHVADYGWRGGIQRLVAPLWYRLAGGCHLTRRTTSVLAAHPGFDPLEIERLPFGIVPVKPFVRGRLRRRA